MAGQLLEHDRGRDHLGLQRCGQADHGDAPLAALIQDDLEIMQQRAKALHDRLNGYRGAARGRKVDLRPVVKI
jgi:hypothetical protein